jgi:hypothetical protein
LHNNAPSNSALVAKTFLAKHGVVEIIHPYHSPDVTASDFFLFPKVKTALKGKRFIDVEDIKKNVMAELNTVPLEAFDNCFQELLKQCKKCIQVGRDCFENK